MCIPRPRVAEYVELGVGPTEEESMELSVGSIDGNRPTCEHIRTGSRGSSESAGPLIEGVGSGDKESMGILGFGIMGSGGWAGAGVSIRELGSLMSGFNG